MHNRNIGGSSSFRVTYSSCLSFQFKIAVPKLKRYLPNLKCVLIILPREEQVSWSQVNSKQIARRAKKKRTAKQKFLKRREHYITKSVQVTWKIIFKSGKSKLFRAKDRWRAPYPTVLQFRDAETSRAGRKKRLITGLRLMFVPQGLLPKPNSRHECAIGSVGLKLFWDNLVKTRRVSKPAVTTVHPVRHMVPLSQYYH